MVANGSSFHTALVNDAFNSSETEGTIAYWKLLSEVIAGRFPVIPGVVPHATAVLEKCYREATTNGILVIEYICRDGDDTVVQ
jgi:hypothetical protein